MGSSAVGERHFFPAADAKEAASNKIVNYLGWYQGLEGTRFAALEPALGRITCVAVLPVCAGLDMAYNAVWLVVKTGFVAGRKVVQVASKDKYGKWCDHVTVEDLRTHAVKTVSFGICIVAGPAVGVVSPDYIVKRYRQRDLIIGKEEDSRWKALLKKIPGGEFVLDKVEPAAEFVLNKIEGGAEYTLEKVKDVYEVAVEHKGKTLTVALTAVGAAAFTLTRIDKHGDGDVGDIHSDGESSDI